MYKQRVRQAGKSVTGVGSDKLKKRRVPATPDPGLKRYWDLRSADYHEQTGIDHGVYRSVVEYLSRDGIFLPGDAVLDIGCGPGTYALLFSMNAVLVTGIDLSEGMLSKMIEAAATEGIKNIRPVCTSWEKFKTKKSYDLVFSSFCPGINDVGALLRMEERSRRSCCCITSGNASQMLPVDRLWELLTGERVLYDPSDAMYLYNILYFSDRSPSLRSFKYEIMISVPSEKLVSGFIAYFEMYMDMDRHKRTIIKNYVASISSNDLYKATGRDTLNVITWDK